MHREKRKGLHVVFIDLEKAYDKVCREELWRVLHECGVQYLIRGMSRLYNGSRACVKLSSRVGEYFFEVRRWLRQGCLMPSWLFNVLFDRVVRQGNDREMGRGVKLRDEDGGGVEKLSKYYIQMTVFGRRNKRVPPAYCN